MRKLLAVGVLGLLGCAGGFASIVDVTMVLDGGGALGLSLTNGGILTGQVGHTVGWGFSLSTEGTYGMGINNTYFCPTSTYDALACYSGYTDVAAGNSIGIDFNGLDFGQGWDGTGQGFGSFVVQNQPTFGYLLVDFVLIDNQGGQAEVQPDAPAFIAAEVDPITDSTGAPEPATWMLMGLGTVALGAWKRRTAN